MSGEREVEAPGGQQEEEGAGEQVHRVPQAQHPAVTLAQVAAEHGPVGCLAHHAALLVAAPPPPPRLHRTVHPDAPEPGEGVPGEARHEQDVEPDVAAEEPPDPLPLEPEEAGYRGMPEGGGGKGWDREKVRERVRRMWRT